MKMHLVNLEGYSICNQVCMCQKKKTPSPDPGGLYLEFHPRKSTRAVKAKLSRDEGGTNAKNKLITRPLTVHTDIT